MNKLSFYKFPFLIVFVFLIIGCKSKQHLPVQKEIQPNEMLFTENTTDSIFEKMNQNQFHYDWLSAKFSADYEVDNNNTSFSGQIRIQKDSVIWISISKFSIDIARLLITQDSVQFINWTDNSYFKTDFNYINRFVNNAVDFDMLQAFFVGNDFKYYENNKFKTYFDGMQYHLTTVNRHKLKKYIKNENDKLKILVQTILIDPVTFKINDLTVKEVKANNKLNANYGNYENIKGQLFPHKLNVLISAEKEIKINIVFSRVNVDEPLNFPFRIPGSYERLIPK